MAEHLSAEQLLRYVDSELSESAARGITKHLRMCTTCALELDRLKQHLAVIDEAEVEIIERSLPPPPAPWPSLQSRLAALEKTGKLTRWRALFRPFEVIWRLPLAYGSAALALLLSLLLIWGPMHVSAKEVIQRATAADTARLAITARQVIRQRVRITEKPRVASSVRSARLESWKSTKYAYWETRGDSVNSDLRHRYEENGLASDLPLSPPALQSWMKLAGSEPTTSREGTKIDVSVASNAVGLAHGLDEFSFRVQTYNWHVEQMKLSFADATFQIDEEDSSILDRGDAPTDVLPRLEPPEVKPDANDAHASTAPPAVNLDDLEMAVRYNLHQMGADLGDSIEITRASRELVVNALGVPPQRKEQLTALLANKPGVRLELEPQANGQQTRLNPKTLLPPPDARQQDARLLAFFGDAGAEENYTRAVLKMSTDTLAHLYALDQLALRWPPGQRSDLSPAAERELAAILRDHVNSIQRSVSGLKPQIDFLLKGFGYQAINEKPVPAYDNWQQASSSTLDTARTVDRILRSLLTTSQTPMSLNEGLPKLKQNFEQLQATSQALVN